MAQQRRMKRQNFLVKNKLQAVSLPVLLIAAVLKMVFLGKMAPGRGVEFYVTSLIFVFALAMIFALTIREVVKKAVSYRNSRNQYKNALKMMKTGAFAGGILGALLFVILMFTAGKMTNTVFLQQAYGNFPMVLAAAGIPFLFVSAALLGGFDGFGFEMPAGTSRIIFACSDLLFGLLLIFLACRMGKKHSLLLHDDWVLDAFGASGAAAALAAAALMSALWLTVLALAFKRSMRETVSKDTGRSRESFLEQIMGLLSACLWPFLRYAGFYGAVIVNQILYFKLTKAPVVSDSGIWQPNLVYAGSYGTVWLWFLLPFGLTLLLRDHCSDYLEKIMKKEDLYHGGMRIVAGIKQFLCLILPMICVFGACLLPLHETVLSLESTAVFGLEVSPVYFCIVSALLCFGILEAGMLKGLGRGRTGILCLLAAFLAQTVAAVLIFPKNSGAEAILLCNLIYALVYAAGCAVFLVRYCVYRKHLASNLLLPFGAAFAAVIAAVLCMFLKSAVGLIPAAVIALIVSAFVHMLTLVVTGCVRENELYEFPQGPALGIIGRLLGMFSS